MTYEQNESRLDPKVQGGSESVPTTQLSVRPRSFEGYVVSCAGALRRVEVSPTFH